MRLAKSYNPSEYESDIYALWEKKDAFKPVDGDDRPTFSIAAPPPNANADMHIGYALTIDIEDAIIRYHRMKGKNALFIPGADHAGFETWAVYEKTLASEGKSRFDFSREELYRQVWDFVEQNKHNLQSQIRAVGASVDWSRFLYTLDNKVVAQTYETFKKMWDEELIYRGERIVNYCTFHGTSFADIEVVHEEEKTKLWFIAYPLTEGGGEVVIATTRPETKLGQSALMVHPDDKRYKHLVGKLVNQPLVPGRPIPIIGDEHVEQDFGTGVVTVTPGHDPNDFEVAKRHNLPVINLITTEGKMSDNVPKEFSGMPITQARQAVSRAMDKAGVLRKTERYTHSVGKCYKCGTSIEPLVRDQWFVKMRPLADKAIQALNDKQIAFLPPSKLAQTVRYLTEVKDWNISRQIAWGIPVPAFVNTTDPKDWIFDTRVSQENIEADGKTYQRDPDVFDTWFSSGHWPLVALDYPNSEDFKRFYPLSLMETGGEILYPWVARMIMLGLYITGEVPFKNVYIHGNVLAEDGTKMSKSLGNVVNPMGLITKYGSDALRVGLLTGRRAGVNQGYHPAKIKAGRNFCNKLWNIARYIEGEVGNEHINKVNAKPQSPHDHWILNKLSNLASESSKAMETFRISESFELTYNFVWHDLADWYIEASKVDTNSAMLAYALEQTLKLIHPFAPFVTETIWQTLAWEKDSLLASQTWPGEVSFDQKKTAEFEEIKAIVTEVRWFRTMAGAKPQRLYYLDAQMDQTAKPVAKLAGLKEVAQIPEDYSGGLALTSVRSNWRLDVDPATVAEKLHAKKTAYQKTLQPLKNRLDNPAYLAKAPKELVADTKKQLAEAQFNLDHLQKILDGLKS